MIDAVGTLAIKRTHIRSDCFKDRFANQTKAAALEATEKNKFELKGRYKSSGAGQGIALGAFNVPRGSVRVTAGGRLLQEGLDYTVNYEIGRVKILDEGLRASNIPINISVENNSFFNQQNKRFSGFDLIHQLNENTTIGATLINLSENPLTLEELSNRYGVSRERIRQIEAKAFEKLQTKMTEKAKDINLLQYN